MEDYEQKINSGNVFLQSQAVTKLHAKALDRKADGTSLYESEEVKCLWQTANKGDVTEATLAVETIISLVRSGQLPMPATLQNFLADVTCAKSPGALVQGITEIILLLSVAESESSDGKIQCPFTGPPKGPTHPFVTLITKRPDLTSAVLEEVASLMRNPDPKLRSRSMLHVRPLILHTFCLTENMLPVTRPLLSLIISAHNQSSLDFIPLLCRVLTLIKGTSKDHIERKVMILSALAEISLGDNSTRLQEALLPCLVMTIPIALKTGLGTRTLERYINSIASRVGRGCDITICALAEALPSTSGQLQVNLLKLGAALLSNKDGNPLIGARLLPSLLQVLAAPCTSIPGLTTAAAALVSLIQATPSQASANTQLAGNPYWETLCCTYSSLVSYIPALEFSDRLVRDPQQASDWLMKLATSTNQISVFHYTIVTSVFLYQGSTTQSVQEATRVLEREVMKKKTLSLEVFPMILYRLGREPDPTTRLTILYTLPSLAVNKLCVALVLKTLLALWASGSLRPLVLRLVYDLWTVEPRTYTYLSQLIHDKSINTNEIQIARAYVISSVCKSKPSQHGEELLPLLSGFLNECKGDNEVAQTLIALDGIYELCSNKIIDLRTTWRVIAPKLVRDKRPEVTAKLCQLLSLVPDLHVASTEYEKFTEDTLIILWNWATNRRSLIVVEAAFKALEKFNYENFALKMLPKYAKEGHQLPPSMATTPIEAVRKPEDVLKYVPSLGWIKLMKGCPDSHLKFIECFIKSLVSREVAGLPKGIYMTALQEAKRRGIKGSGGQPEPPSYSFFKDSSILKGLINFLLELPSAMDGCDISEEKTRLLQCGVLVLEALGQSLPRPYPALDWILLGKVLTTAQATCHYDWTTKIRHNIFRISAQQCNKSPSAVALISQWLIPSPANGLTREDEIVLFGLMEHLGRGLPPTVLQPFIAYIFTQRVSDTYHMKALLEALKPNLTADFIFDTNRNVISNAIEGLNEHIDPENKILYTAYKSCVADLPQKHIERLTSPSLWWEITDERLYRAAVLRCHVAEQDSAEMALPWLNDLVDSAAALPGDRSHLLRVMSSTLVIRCQVKESTTWLLQLLGRLRDHLKKNPGDNLVAAHEQQQKILFYFDLLIMAIVVWSGLWATNAMEVLTEKPTLRDRLLLPSLVTLSGQPAWTKTLNQILNWLVSCHSLLHNSVSSRYHLGSPTLLLATLNPNLTQAMWNKVISILI
ncbi:focadhesin [Palaemon carinicauda]|uniref:focadhesin n=1 Tax=Palaemon carinicauda TaxID=392227 RepID=UPI0035B63751